MLEQNIDQFRNWLNEAGGCAYLGSEAHSKGAPELASLDDFEDHQAVYLWSGPRTGVLMGVFLHRIKRGPGAGGVRFWRYDTVGEFLRDGLRLARGMTRKNALAQLWWGGGKGVIARPEGSFDRIAVFHDYADLVSRVRGAYVTAEDVGTTPEDMATIFQRTRFTTCIPAEFGGSGNPSGPTARGVFAGLEALAEYLGHGSLKGLRVGVQGLGQVGFRLAGHLRTAGAHVLAHDIDSERCRRAAAELQVELSPDLLTEELDLLAPCALGGVFNPDSIGRLRTRGICGAANNQLEVNRRDAELLRQADIAYVPDFLTNRMGIVPLRR